MRNEIDAVAAEWVAREDAGALSPAEGERLAAWLAADSRHLGAYARMQAIMSSCDRLHRGEHAPDAADARVVRPQVRAWAWRVAALAASLALVAVAALRFLDGGADTYTTRIGEISRVSLDDGSVVTLNTDSRVRVRFDEGHRNIELLRGEAMFDVAKDRRRPFAVAAGGTRVVAVGTSFSVRRSPERVNVLVREGVVKVDEAEQPVARLQAGDKASIAGRGAPVVARVDTVEVHRELAWRDGMIAFSGETLQEVAREFARYNTLRIRIADPEVAGLEVVGMFSATDPIGFSRAAAQSMHLDMALGDNEIVLRARAKKKAAAGSD
ncbi:FecR family protein [Stenotrophomonas acidaminiphila]